MALWDSTSVCYHNYKFILGPPQKKIAHSHQAHKRMGCNLYYDFHFSGTIPKKMNFHLPDYVKSGKWADNCKVYLNFYLGKPYRVDVQADGIFIPPTNARWVNNELEFERPRLDKHTPSLRLVFELMISVRSLIG